MINPDEALLWLIPIGLVIGIPYAVIGGLIARFALIGLGLLDNALAVGTAAFAVVATPPIVLLCWGASKGEL